MSPYRNTNFDMFTEYRYTGYSKFEKLPLMLIEIALISNRRWVAQNLTRPVEMRYNPYTQTIEARQLMRNKS